MKDKVMPTSAQTLGVDTSCSISMTSVNQLKKVVLIKDVRITFS